MSNYYKKQESGVLRKEDVMKYEGGVQRKDGLTMPSGATEAIRKFRRKKKIKPIKVGPKPKKEQLKRLEEAIKLKGK